ncbi:MFS transporter [Caenimonas aquaedulcis]|uniref:MFS transporter n=1 Tax=Caenimonas aquaedulcis TaxID=2793270 RepID=A0A931H6A8_9BURK|nr:MFS transporter [Caenimonas aquaedulcis]MBG9389444.1 MFS transporter [Caenimonas aquaedulcis]
MQHTTTTAGPLMALPPPAASIAPPTSAAPVAFGAARVTLAAAGLMALAMGGRSAIGLFVSPLNSWSGLGLANLSLALAIGQLAVGVTQPLLGAIADRFGAARVVAAGALLLALSTALPAATGIAALIAASLIITSVAASAVGSNGLLLGEVNRAVPAGLAGVAVGIVGAGGSAGQLLIGPTMQWTIHAHGWRAALVVLAAASLVALPLAFALRRGGSAASASHGAPIADALGQWSFWRPALSFGLCGFHVAFLNVHMPGVIERCGLPSFLAGTWLAISAAANIAGSIAIGLAMKRHNAQGLLAAVYCVRAAGIALLLLLPVSSEAMLAFGVLMGASTMATVPPTAQLIAREHGVARLGTLLGIVMVVHQLGSFAGIWLGGWAAEATGSDALLWGIDLPLCLVAALIVMPRRR